MVTLRQFIAMLLLAVFGLPIALSSLAVGQGTDDGGLPACCRRAGEHHCTMTMGQRAASRTASEDRVWRAPIERCPYCPASPGVSAHADLLLAGAVPPAVVFHFGPAEAARRAECSHRVALERARHKRGPPSISLA